MNFSFVISTYKKLFVVLLFLLLSFNFVQAQESAGVGIKPAVIEDLLDLSTVKTYTVQVTNLSNVDQTFYLSKRDIVGVLEGGVPIFAESSAEPTRYELSSWITIDKTSVLIPANQTESINFILEVPSETSPGGHFGAIVVSVEPPEMRSSGASIGYEVANIISIRIAGEVDELAQIRQFSTEKFIHSAIDVDFSARIENLGNTLIKPTGPLEISNMFGKKVGIINFNENKSGIFPGTTRDFTINWQDDSPGFGRYEAILSTVYGGEGNNNTISSTVSFWILPMNIILPALGILLFLFLVIYVVVRIYIKRTVTIMTAGSTRRLVRTRKQNQFPVFLVFVSMLTVTALVLIILLLLFS